MNVALRKIDENKWVIVDMDEDWGANDDYYVKKSDFRDAKSEKDFSRAVLCFRPNNPFEVGVDLDYLPLIVEAMKKLEQEDFKKDVFVEKD